jgi:hypothetical protein
MPLEEIIAELTLKVARVLAAEALYSFVTVKTHHMFEDGK